MPDWPREVNLLRRLTLTIGTFTKTFATQLDANPLQNIKGQNYRLCVSVCVGAILPSHGP